MTARAPGGRPQRLRGAAASGAAVAAYGWWATGLRSFTAPAYLAVGLPVAVLTIAATVDPPGRPAREQPPGTTSGRRRRLRAVFPWALVLLLAAGLEGVALTLGGRSPAVPTLSTVVDHALGWHTARCVLFCGWLAAGSAPVRRVVGRRRGRPA